MRLLIAAPAAPPRFEGPQLLAAARALGAEAALFDATAARDPTLDLPEAALAFRPSCVLLVQPQREEPATVELLRAFGAFVIVWTPPAGERAGPRLLERRRWIARAADAVAATDAALAAELRDRRGRAAAVLPPGFCREALEGGPDPLDSGFLFASVRAADDPLLLTGAARELRGFGDASAFPKRIVCSPLRDAAAFAGAVRGRRYLVGARRTRVPPSVFDDGAAAAAFGCTVAAVGPMQALADAADVAMEIGSGRLADRLATLFEWAES